MKEPERTPIYRKDPKVEAFLERFNDCVAELEMLFENDGDPDTSRPIFIVGPPRSGSTLLSQVLASAGFGYISNFVARFWRAPAAGVYFQKLQGASTKNQRPTSFSSNYGVTKSWLEPHEFGYYWNRRFDLGQDTHTLDKALRARVDTQGLRRSIAAICAQFENPVVFKNTTWCSAQADMLAASLPQSLFVFITRDIICTASSILQARRSRYGSDHVWWSNRPSTYRELQTKSPAVQVVRQVTDLLSETEQSIAKVPRERIIRLTYEDLCRDPKRAVKMIGSAAGLRREMNLAEIPSSFEISRVVRAKDRDCRLIARTWEKIKETKL
jgi:LPS sulfotransferase NodH